MVVVAIVVTGVEQHLRVVFLDLVRRTHDGVELFQQLQIDRLLVFKDKLIIFTTVNRVVCVVREILI